MSTALVCMASEYGGVNGSLALALGLQKAGWRVVYTGTEEIGEYVRAQGLERQLLVPPSAGKVDPEAIRKRWLASRVIPKLTERAALVERLIADHSAIIERVRPDVVLVDPVLPILAVAPLQRCVPVLGLNPTYAGVPERGVPPVFSSSIPGAKGEFSELRCRLEWGKLFAKQWPGRCYSWLVSQLLSVDVKAMLRAAGGRVAGFEYGFLLDVPELVLAPRALDFPGRQGRESRLYLGTCVTPLRMAGSDSIQRFLDGRKVAYCSLGTLNAHYVHRIRLLRAAIEAFAGRPEWQLVVASGHVEPGLFDPLPENVLVERRIPQQEVLAKAQVFITHGGAGSVREAIHFGVPLVVLPCGLDQCGLAARIVFHGAGVRGDIADVTSESISTLVDSARSDRVRRGMAALHEAAAAACALQRGVEWLQRYTLEQARSTRAPGRNSDAAGIEVGATLSN